MPLLQRVLGYRRSDFRRSGFQPRLRISVVSRYIHRAPDRCRTHHVTMGGQRPHGANLRKGRHSDIGQYYSLTTCAHARRPIFNQPDRAKIVLDAIRWLHTRERFTVDAAVVMPDHLHVVGQLRAGALLDFMHSLKSFTAKRLTLSGVEAPVWQAGYHDHCLREDEDYKTKVRYVLENPIRAGLVERVADYRFLILPSWFTGEL